MVFIYSFIRMLLRSKNMFSRNNFEKTQKAKETAAGQVTMG